MLRCFKTLLIIVFILCFGETLFAFQTKDQTPFVRNLSSGDGLNTRAIYDLFIDNNGLLFLGTDLGLVSYNGIFFKTYPFKDNLSLSVHKLQQTEDGRMWCKNFSDQIFVFENDSLKAYSPANLFLKRQKENLTDFIFYDGILYLLTDNNLYAETSKGSFESISKTEINDMFFSIYKDELSQKLYVLSKNELKIIENNEVTQTQKVEEGQKDLIVFENELYYIIKGNDNKLFHINGEIAVNKKNEKYNYFNNIVSTKNKLWLCSSSGMYDINTDSKSIRNLFLEKYRITDVVEDYEGNYWISSLDHGLFFMPHEEMKIFLTEEKLDSNNFTSIKTDSLGIIFAGNSKGEIIEIDQEQNLRTIYKIKTSVEVEFIYPYKDLIFTSNGIFNRGEKEPVISSYLGKDLATDNLGNFVSANYNSAGIFSTSLNGEPSIPEGFAEKQTINYISEGIKLYVFRNKRSRAVIYSKLYDQYYVGFSDGLFLYQLNGEITEIKDTNDQPIIATDFYEDENGYLWVSSMQQGLFKIKDNKIIKTFNKDNGLSANTCRTLQSDHNGIWVLTSESLDFIDTSGDHVKNYGYNLGINGISVNDFILTQDKIWLATSEGLMHLPKNIIISEWHPRLSLSAKHKNGNSLENHTKLKYENNDLLFTINSILYKSFGNFNYEYKLQPFHEDWQILEGKQNKLNFVALTPDNYQLKVRIKAGSFVSHEEVFLFTVLKPFWQENWFFALFFLVLCLLLYIVYKWAVARTQRIQSINEKLATSQLTALRSQMNPHFMFNILNAVQGLIYSNQKRKANSFIGTFSTLMRKTLDVSGKREITIKEELETIELYISLEKARFEDGEFCYEIVLPREELSQYTLPSLIVQPFVENAIKHGLMHKRGLKKLILQLEKYDEKYWKLSIEDNGIGRKKSMQINQKIEGKPKPFAMNAFYERIELINKLSQRPIKIEVLDLVSDSQESAGTRVTLFIPINHENTNS